MSSLLSRSQTSGAGLSRRSFVAGAAALLAGCPSAAPPPPAAPTPAPLPPLHTSDLTGLLPLAHLRWAILTKPREIAEIPWLIPPIARIAPEENLSRFAASTGF